MEAIKNRIAELIELMKAKNLSDTLYDLYINEWRQLNKQLKRL